jgi:hypothetical protein
MGGRRDDSIVLVPYFREMLLDSGLAVFEDYRDCTHMFLPVNSSSLELLKQRPCPFAYDLAPSAVPMLVGKLVDVFD